MGRMDVRVGAADHTPSLRERRWYSPCALQVEG